MASRTAWIATLLAFLMALPAPGRAQEGQEVNPAAALASALVAACRHNETQFAHYLTADNATAFQQLPASQRKELMKRFVLLGDPGRPLLSNDTQGRTILRCESPGAEVEMRFQPERVRENLAFIPVEVTGGRRSEFGMVREGGGWRLLSLGLLLLNIPELSQRWASEEIEGREEAAIAALRRLADAIATYRRAFGNLPESLEQLGPAPKEGVSPEAAQLVDAELAAGKKGGYLFRYRILPAAGEGAEPSFELAAVPAEYGKTGRRSFFLDASGKLRGADKQGAVATSADPPIEERR